MFLHVKKAKYISSYRIWLQFNNGAEGEIDLSWSSDGTLLRTAGRADIERILDASTLIESSLSTGDWADPTDTSPDGRWRAVIRNSRLEVVPVDAYYRGEP